MRLLLKPGRQCQRIGTVAFHSHVERFERLTHKPGVHRRKCRSRLASELGQLLHRELVTDHDAADCPALPVEKLGCRVDYDVGSQVNRPLDDRRGKGVVDYQKHALLPAESGQPGQVD